MLVGVQWATSSPGDWEWFDLTPATIVAYWEKGPKKPKPSGVVTPDRNRGWIAAANIQGIIFEGLDCYAVQLSPFGNGLVVTAWNEDVVGERLALEWTLLDPAPDGSLGGVINTQQTLRDWYENPPSRGDESPPSRPWEDFVRPAEAITRYGPAVSDELYAQHRAARSHRGWRDWIV